MSASLRSTARSEPVHLPNYDNLEAGEVDVRNKLLPVVDKRVLDEMEQAKKLAKAARNLDGFTDLLRDDLRRRMVKVADDIEKHLADLKERVTNLESFRSGERRAQDLLTKAKNTVEAVTSSEVPCKAALGAVRVAVSEKNTKSIAQVVAVLKPCTEALAKVRAEAEATKQAADLLANDANLKGLAADVSREIEAALDSVTKIEFFGTFFKRAQPSLEAPAWAPAAAVTDRRLADLVDTRLDLTTTPRQLGDTVSYRGSIRDEERGVDVVEGPLRSLTVVQNGASVRVSGSVVFVQPFDRAQNEDKFRAAPALTASLYYRCARNSGHVAPSGACAFWNVLSPGIGAQVATVVMGDLEKEPDTGERVAVSNETPHVTPALVGQLIGDLAQGGAGYDFQSARAYWFLGIGIQTMTDLGFDFQL